jgi:diguanylate cyclase (GGDEF)-like protein
MTPPNQLLDEISEGVLTLNAQGIVTWSNRIAHQLLGHATLVGMALQEAMSPERLELLDAAECDGSWVSMPPEPGRVALVARWLTTDDGRALIVRDATAEMVWEHRWKGWSDLDRLTGLPSRGHLVEHTVGLMQQGHSVAVLHIDLDGFHRVNEAYGHDSGDHILLETADRLATAAAHGDRVSRVGSDEFVLVTSALGSLAAATGLAHAVSSALSLPFEVDGRTVQLSASVGLAVWDGVASAEELWRDADIASSEARSTGRGRVGMVDDTVRMRRTRRLELERALSDGVRHGEMIAYYQPIVDLVTGRVTKAEALVRWQRGHELVGPAEFIDLAESNGLIVDIGAQVLRSACCQAQLWQQALPGVGVSVNLSPRQLTDDRLGSMIARVLADTGLDPALLTLEITETALLADAAAAGRALAITRSLGVHVALDDFGTGFSSLTHLREMPVQMVKIDRSFVSRLEAHKADAIIVRSIIDLAAGLGLDVVAEGVETPAQRSMLNDFGCPSAQGYLFSPPTPAAHLEGVIAFLGGTC